MAEDFSFIFHCYAKLFVTKVEVNEWITDEKVYSTLKNKYHFCASMAHKTSLGRKYIVSLHPTIVFRIFQY
jgi:hypothetical protein